MAQPKYRISKTVNPSGTEVNFTLPCSQIGAPDGNLKLWHICTLFQCARTEALHSKGFLSSSDGKSVYDTHATFIVVGEFDFLTEFYRIYKPRTTFGSPINFQAEFVNFGKSTLTLILRLRDPLDNLKTLATMKLLYVAVDRKTRKSAPLPDWLVTTYEQYRQPTNNVRPYKLMPRPADKFCHKFQVMRSDIDHNNHLNNAEYVRMCMDTLDEASREGYLKLLTGDVTQYACTSMRALYAAESRLGDILHVYLWEDSTSQTIIHYQITREGSPIFQCSMQFYLFTTPKL